MKHLLPLTACALIASTATALAEGNLPLGEWEVTAVRLQDPSQRITAIIENDPSYMGVVLSIADEAMAWRPNGSVPESTALEDCPGPIILPATESPDRSISSPAQWPCCAAMDRPGDRGGLSVTCAGRHGTLVV
ncbi:hypothetical protein [Haematobacter missouriensis]|uniref:DUF2147 domain-containing protein n=1 Tax=Haematobacter missouriensis TaxID=366616 RepID=A0ABX3ZQA0_9RHOB|nr:hypothetical protein [Haematobacter missouriensis]OWJ73340.1 hypothetical protein CDV53_15790 [Haematobacter missouriensis]